MRLSNGRCKITRGKKDHHGPSKHEQIERQIEKLAAINTGSDSGVLERLANSLKEYDARHAAYLEWEKAWKAADKQTRLIMLIQRSWGVKPVENVSLDGKQDNIPFAPPLPDGFDVDAEVRNQSPPRML
jgi:hypothetical protein